MNTRIVCGAILIILIVLIYFYCSINVSNYEKYLYGLWVGDDDFCSDAMISSMLIFIGEPTYKHSTIERKCHIIIQDDISNQGFTLKYSSGYGSPFISKYTIHAKCEFESENLFISNDSDSDNDDTTTSKITLTVNILMGLLTIYRGDQLYGKLYKQNDISDILAV